MNASISLNPNLGKITSSASAKCFCEDGNSADEEVHWMQSNASRCWFHVNCDNVIMLRLMDTLIILNTIARIAKV